VSTIDLVSLSETGCLKSWATRKYLSTDGQKLGFNGTEVRVADEIIARAKQSPTLNEHGTTIELSKTTTRRFATRLENWDSRSAQSTESALKSDNA
jgi:hypothetical protein